MWKVTRLLFQLWKVVQNIVHSVWCLYARGEEVSRPLDDVLAEIATLAEKGVREISLLGQNVQWLPR